MLDNTKMNRRRFMAFTGMAISSSFLPGCTARTSTSAQAGNSAEPKTPPNILVIMTDDAGYHDFGFQGNPTFAKILPNIDRIANEGMVFRQAYATSSVCAPSRAGFITGRYQQKFGFQNNFPQHWVTPPDPVWQEDTWKNFGLCKDQPTIAEYLKKKPYRTAIFGKWHLGYAHKFYPTERGFDEFWGLRAGSRSYFSQPNYNTTERIPVKYHSIEHNGKVVPESEITYVTEDLGKQVRNFIKTNAQGDESLFIFASFTAPHTPMHAKDEDIEVIEQWLPDAEPRRKRYAAMMYNLDCEVGNILEVLEETGLAENTLIVFVNDNGGSYNNASDNTPLRDYKWSPYEGGIRVPMAISWPGHIKPGSVCREMVSLMDLCPTFLEAAGLPHKEGFDGVSLVSLLSGKSEHLPDRTLFFRESHSRQGAFKAAISGDLKYFQAGDYDTPRFFDFTESIAEKNNLYPDSSEKCKKLAEQLEAWEKKMQEPLWGVSG